MTRKSRSRSAAPNSSATPKAAAESNATARDKYLKEVATNPMWKEAPKTGQVFGIVGAQPMSAVKK
jgi:hypothetical protein